MSEEVKNQVEEESMDMASLMAQYDASSEEIARGKGM